MSGLASAGSLVPAVWLWAAALLALLVGVGATWSLMSASGRRPAVHRPAVHGASGPNVPAKTLPGPEEERLRERVAELEKLEQEHRALAREHRALIGRARAVASRDREELIRLQEELEEERRIGKEKARIIRTAERVGQRERHETLSCQARLERQRASLVALEGALDHAKRGQERAENLCARLREQLKHARQAPLPSSPAPLQGAAERIVYRDREVPVEVPFGFTPLPASVPGLRPTNSTNRPSSP